MKHTKDIYQELKDKEKFFKAESKRLRKKIAAEGFTVKMGDNFRFNTGNELSEEQFQKTFGLKDK